MAFREPQAHTVYITQTLTTPAVHVYNMMRTTMHGWLDDSFQSIRGCKQTQAGIIDTIAVALIGNYMIAVMAAL